ncbi:hypothetical protein ACNFIA_14830 [Pseudomonas sp. NY15437]|uniref:hypothetical protein n=1 Tax=Pseudomonas sp. NY15437 TaxID=3400360 RepID=UPI000AA8E0C0
MSQPKTIKAAPMAQQDKPEAKTTGCGFWGSPLTGHTILQVNPGIPCSAVMANATTLNDGIFCLLRRLADEGEGEANGMELQVLAMAASTVGAMFSSCQRAFERQEGEA